MTERRLSLRTKDDFPLSAHHFIPGDAARGVVVMAGATGVAQRYYRRFAEALVEQRLEVFTLDYRGIGESKPSSLRGFDCRYADWVADLDAVVDAALARGPTVVVGHSFGGHAFGQLARPNDTRGLFTVASGAGWAGYMPLGERLRIEAFWRVLGPVATRLHGYAPGRVWGGEDLPLGVYENWKRWAARPHYFFDDATLDMQAVFDRVTVPVVGVTATDDLWASPRSQQAFLSHYRNAPLTLETQSPRSLGATSVGHMGHFKKAVLPAFLPRVLRFIDERLGAVAQA